MSNLSNSKLTSALEPAITTPVPLDLRTVTLPGSSATSRASSSPVGGTTGLIGASTSGRAIAAASSGLASIRLGGNVAVGEAGRIARVLVVRGGNLSRTSRVFYQTQTTGGNAAAANRDFTPVRGVVTFAPGVSRQFINVPIINDRIAEGDEVFSVTLTNIDRNVSLNAPRTARVTIIDDDVPRLSRRFNYANFASVAGLRLNGVAARVGNALRLTPDVLFQRGAAYYTAPINLTGNASFQTQFRFRIGGRQGTTGTDGFTFTVQNTEFGLNTLGGFAGEMGYGSGGARSLAIAFDTWDNGDEDINDNNIAVRLNGNVLGTLPARTVASPFDLNNGATYTSWIDYASGRLNVYLSRTAVKPRTPTLTYNVDLGALLGNRMYVGFTGGTGGRSNTHDILNWSFNSAAGGPVMSFTQPSITVREGGTAAVTIRRNGDVRGTATAILETVNGTAIAGQDYQAVRRFIRFAPGQVMQTVNIRTLANTAIEENESFRVRLRNVTGVPLGSPNGVTVNILDGDVTGRFARAALASGLNAPTAIDWTPPLDGSGRRLMYVAEKGGVVRIMENGQLLGGSFIDISPRVNSNPANDRGLLGIAVDPNFGQNRGRDYVYLLYTYDPPEAAAFSGDGGRDGLGNRPSRLSRVTADPATGFRTAIPGSEVVLLGTNSNWQFTSNPGTNSSTNFANPPSGIHNGTTINAPPSLREGATNNIRDYLATDSDTHSIGFLKFGTDGSLFVSNGDGTSYNGVDPRTFRVQDLDNLSGKLLRIDPLTGQGLSDNPFFNGDPNSNRSKVFNYGLRNPFRFAINPRTNTPYIGDVGFGTWEEINRGRGANFGWPYYEGGRGVSEEQGGYRNLPQSQAFYGSGGLSRVVAPLVGRSHDQDGANAIIMGDFYTGTLYPDQFRGALFFTDVFNNNVFATFFNGDGSVRDVRPVMPGQDWDVQLVTGPDGYLYYVNMGERGVSNVGSIGRFNLV